MNFFNFTQATPATTWTINHNLNAVVTSDVMILFNGSYTKILPASVTATSANQLVITFDTAYQGTARIAG